MKTTRWFYPAILVCLTVACNGPMPEKTPKDTVLALLDLHGLRGRLPEDRPKDLVDQPIPREKLLPLFVDLDKYDPFIGDLYVGFVVGALSRYQTRLFETRTGSEATFKAGQAVIFMKQVDGVWRISLEKSIPEPLKARATAEKERYENAKAAGQAVQ